MPSRATKFKKIYEAQLSIIHFEKNTLLCIYVAVYTAFPTQNGKFHKLPYIFCGLLGICKRCEGRV